MYYVRTDVAPGMKAATDLVKAQGLISGGLAADNSKDLLIRLSLDMLGVPFKHVTGYRSNNTARLALQRSEINFFAESPPGYRSVVEPNMVKAGEVIPTYYDPGWNGASLLVPQADRGARSCRSRSFTRRSRAASLPASSGTSTSRALPSILPCSACWCCRPTRRRRALDALRAAALELNNDKEFADDAIKTIGFVPDYAAGPDTNAEVRRALVLSPEMRAFATQYMKAGGK